MSRLDDNRKIEFDTEEHTENVTEGNQSEDVQKQTEELEDELNKTEKDIRKSERRFRNFQTFILQLIIFIVIVWLLFWRFIGISLMPSNDMHPRIDVGDVMLFYRLDKTPKNNEVVVYTYDGETAVGRVVAKAGDVVDITDKEYLVINGNTIQENGIYEKTPRYEGFIEYPYTVPDDSYFILVDHRDGGKDSRYYGAIKKNQLEGVVVNILRRHNL